jgi:5'-deoxynucleotidase
MSGATAGDASPSPLFAYLYRLRLIGRWGLMRSSIPENVAEHTYQVALVTHALGTIAREVFGRTDVPVERAVVLALFHDATEVVTGDIPMPVKHHNPRILESLRELENLAADQLVAKAPEPLRATYRDLISPTPDDEVAWNWVKAADKVDAYLKCISEVALGNPEFAVARRQLEASVKALAMPEVDYFVAQFAPGFSMTLDELSDA